MPLWWWKTAHLAPLRKARHGAMYVPIDFPPSQECFRHSMIATAFYHNVVVFELQGQPTFAMALLDCELSFATSLIGSVFEFNSWGTSDPSISCGLLVHYWRSPNKSCVHIYYKKIKNKTRLPFCSCIELTSYLELATDSVDVFVIIHSLV